MPCFPATLRSHQLATCGSTDLHRRRRKVACVANVSGAPGDGPGDKLPGHSRDSLVGDKSTLILLLICSSFSTLRIKWDPPMKGSEPDKQGCIGPQSCFSLRGRDSRVAKMVSSIPRLLITIGNSSAQQE